MLSEENSFLRKEKDKIRIETTQKRVWDSFLNAKRNI